MNTRIAIAGASGRMGQALIEATLAAGDLALAGALDIAGSPAIGTDAGTHCGRVTGVHVQSDVAAVVSACDVLIDFTRPAGTLGHLAACAQARVAAVVGTTPRSASFSIVSFAIRFLRILYQIRSAMISSGTRNTSSTTRNTSPASHGASCTNCSNESYSRSLPRPSTRTRLRPFSMTIPWFSTVTRPFVVASVSVSASSSADGVSGDVAPGIGGTGGMGTAAFVALVMSLCDHRYTATQFALLSSLEALGRVFAGRPSAEAVGMLGWGWFFFLSFVLALPGCWLVWQYRRQLPQDSSDESSPESPLMKPA